MKSFTPFSPRVRGISLAATFALMTSVMMAADPADASAAAGDKAADKTASKIEDYRTNSTEMNKTEVKAALQQIDSELDHLDNLADSATTPEQKNEIKAQYKALKMRRNDLKKDFTRARYEAFKSDLNAETEKVSSWSKETFSTKPAATSAANTTSAAADTSAEKIGQYQAESTDVNKAEVKASLARLDADIDLLSAKIDAVSDPVRKDELKMTLNGLKDRRTELNSEFRKARYDALVADVKGEWNKLTN